MRDFGGPASAMDSWRAGSLQDAGQGNKHSSDIAQDASSTRLRDANSDHGSKTTVVTMETHPSHALASARRSLERRGLKVQSDQDDIAAPVVRTASAVDALKVQSAWLWQAEAHARTSSMSSSRLRVSSPETAVHEFTPTTFDAATIRIGDATSKVKPDVSDYDAGSHQCNGAAPNAANSTEGASHGAQSVAASSADGPRLASTHTDARREDVLAPTGRGAGYARARSVMAAVAVVGMLLGSHWLYSRHMARVEAQRAAREAAEAKAAAAARVVNALGVGVLLAFFAAGRAQRLLRCLRRDCAEPHTDDGGGSAYEVRENDNDEAEAVFSPDLSRRSGRWVREPTEVTAPSSMPRLRREGTLYST